VQLGRRRLAPDTGGGAPVRSLTYVAGSPAHLLVFGGQLIDQPDMLSLMPLHASGAVGILDSLRRCWWVCMLMCAHACRSVLSSVSSFSFILSLSFSLFSSLCVHLRVCA
jgi:hypothetical protein